MLLPPQLFWLSGEWPAAFVCRFMSNFLFYVFKSRASGNKYVGYCCIYTWILLYRYINIRNGGGGFWLRAPHLSAAVLFHFLFALSRLSFVCVCVNIRRERPTWPLLRVSARDINQSRLTSIVHSTTIARSIYVTHRGRQTARMTCVSERFSDTEVVPLLFFFLSSISFNIRFYIS